MVPQPQEAQERGERLVTDFIYSSCNCANALKQRPSRSKSKSPPPKRQKLLGDTLDINFNEIEGMTDDEGDDQEEGYT